MRRILIQDGFNFFWACVCVSDIGFNPFTRVQKTIWPLEIISSKNIIKKSFNDMIRTAWLSRIYQYSILTRSVAKVIVMLS